MQGIAYGVGVGPGDPELMTIKAVRLIRESKVIAFPARAAGESTAFPARAAEESTAFRIAAKVVPEIRNKTLLPIFMPMVRDRLLIAWTLTVVLARSPAFHKLSISSAESGALFA